MAEGVSNQQLVSRFIKSQLREAIKNYYVYDISNRLTDSYTAPVDAADGDPCLRTQYAYDGVTVRITKSKESMSTWDSAWEI